MKPITARKKKQLVAMSVISIIGVILLIVHGVLLDLNFSQISRLTLGVSW